MDNINGLDDEIPSMFSDVRNNLNRFCELLVLMNQTCIKKLLLWMKTP